MTAPRSDALVFFGATGDLTYKKIFSALQALKLDDELVKSAQKVFLPAWERSRYVTLMSTERQYQRARDAIWRGARSGPSALEDLRGPHNVSPQRGRSPNGPKHV
jgi:glucose-6-phosphate 1-dehydrogenase